MFYQLTYTAYVISEAMNTSFSCYQCGAQCLSGNRFSESILDRKRVFCCPGCLAIAQTIVSSGFEAYYRYRGNLRSSSKKEESLSFIRELESYSSPDTQKKIILKNNNYSEALLLIEGISCPACAWLIERHAQNSFPGIETSINLTTSRLHIRSNNDFLLSEVIKEINNIGYKASPYQTESATNVFNQENRSILRRLGIAGMLWFQIMMVTMPTWTEFNKDLDLGMDLILKWVSLFLTTPIVFYSCKPIFQSAFKSLRSYHLNMNTSISLAIGGGYVSGIFTIITGSGELYFDSIGMLAFIVLSSNYLRRRIERYADSGNQKLFNMLPASCLRELENGTSECVLLDQIEIGDLVLVHPKSTIPVDGNINSGSSSIDESLLTGESLPRYCKSGDQVIAGTLNINGSLTIKVTSVGKESYLFTIINLLEKTQSQKIKLMDFSEKLGEVLLLFSFSISVIAGIFWWNLDPSKALYIVMAMLMATCPCALFLSTPTALMATTSSLRRAGVLLTKAHVIQTLSCIDTVVFDKTGTLTKGKFALQRVDILFDKIDALEYIELASSLERSSSHPISTAFKGIKYEAGEISESTGLGIEGKVRNQRLRIGSRSFVCELSNSSIPDYPENSFQSVLLGNSERLLAWFILEDPLRPDAGKLVNICREKHWKMLLLSGDSSSSVDIVAKELKISNFYKGISPSKKLEIVKNMQDNGHKVLMFGDGINDLPVLTGADISIVMASSLELVKARADIILISDKLESVGKLFTIINDARIIILENLVWATFYNLLILPFAGIGSVTPVWAALGMSFSSLIITANSIRLLYKQ